MVLRQLIDTVTYCQTEFPVNSSFIIDLPPVLLLLALPLVLNIVDDRRVSVTFRRIDRQVSLEEKLNMGWWGRRVVT